MVPVNFEKRSPNLNFRLQTVFYMRNERITASLLSIVFDIDNQLR